MSEVSRWAILFLLQFVRSPDINAQPVHENSQLLDSEGNVEFQWSYTKETITFQVTAPTSGWIGIGFSPSGSMKDADIIFGWIKDGDKHVLDMHATKNGLPELDSTRNIETSKIEENATHTIMRVRRWLDTCDEEDFKITQDTTRVIFAYGNTDPEGDVPTRADYHGTSNRGVKSIRLLDKRLPSLQRYDGVKSHDVTTAPFVIPLKETYYHCFYHKLPEVDKKHHIVEFRPILTPDNIRNIHHITVFQCKEDLVTEAMLKRSEQCYTNDGGDHWKYCAPVVASWSVGMTSFTLPDHVGVPMGVAGAARVVKMEIHYDNLDKEEGKVDISGLRVYYTDKLRKFDAGTLLTGHDVWPSLFIPPGTSNFVVEGHCSAQCLSKVMSDSGVTDIKAFGVFLHSHTAGSGMVLRHFRNGTELHPIAKDLSYDFDYQESKLLAKEAQINIGDNLIMQCLYDTRKRKVPTIGGLGTRDEMCFGFIMYYPKIADAYCQSSSRTRETFAALGAKNIREAFMNSMREWSEDEITEFNQKQLAGPMYDLCLTLAGKVEGIQKMFDVPAITARYSEAPGRCAADKTYDTTPQKNRTIPEEGESYIVRYTSKSGQRVVIITSTLSAAMIFLMLALIYAKLR